jgi:hypothetical protein
MNSYLLPCLEMGPRVVRRLLRQLPRERLDEALHPDRFTPREVAAHLADWEPIMRERIRTALTSPGVEIRAYDEGQMALDHGYADLDPLEQVELFARERYATAEVLRGLNGSDWANSVHHPERGPQSVEDLANLLLGHDLYHIDQLSEYLG